MPMNFTRVRTLLSDVPTHAKLAYCLLCDERVPAAPKAALAAALVVIVGPLDIPAWIPVMGELDMLALGILAVKVFVDACPEAIVEEHRAALKARRSIFDDDFRAVLGAGRLALEGLLRRVGGGGLRRLRLLEGQREDRSA
ncbi:MAG: hypothetical protein ABI838_00295 [Chloroflexota bacterium]